jgi:hypothetical protein
VPDPATIEAAAGETVMLVNVWPPPAVTVRVAVPEMLPEVALIVVEPAATPVASPALEIVATARLLLDQVANDVQLEVVLFE